MTENFDPYYNYIWSRVYSWLRTREEFLLCGGREKEDLFQECFCRFLEIWRGKEELGGSYSEGQLFAYCYRAVDQVLHTLSSRGQKELFRRVDIEKGFEDSDGNLLDLMGVEDKEISRIDEGRMGSQDIIKKFEDILSSSSNLQRGFVSCKLGENREFERFLRVKSLRKRLGGRQGKRYCSVESMRKTRSSISQFLEVSDYVLDKEIVRLRKKIKQELGI